MTDGMDAYREAADRHRQGLRDPARLTAAYAVSIAGLVVLAVLLLAAYRR
ncbi:hypothetical protein [Kitasatospora aureofaciens]|nr:hypothetical protein [Kitasatospora aureofaciens]MBV6699327.1 hypothetical protein [Kitasatospora aureofaciens]